MKKIKIILLFALSFSFVTHSNGQNHQKIEYDFGKESDILDSIKYVVSWFKTFYKNPDIQLFAGVDRCDGNLNIYISEYGGKSDDIKKLIKKTNRFIPITKNKSLPILFDTDFLAKDLNGKTFIINMNGYYIKAEKNERYIYRVTGMNMTF